jgi:regulator of replication initiation timing
MSYDPIQLDADPAALHRCLREAEQAIAEAYAMKNRLNAHLEELIEDNQRLTIERDYLIEQLGRQTTG